MIALLGYKGSIGSRYDTILKSLGLNYERIEKDDYIIPDRWTKAIIATPTRTHYELAKLCEERKIPYLVEKPATKDINEAEEMLAWEYGFIVNNYSFIAQAKLNIYYNFFKTGSDGLHWDLVQLIYKAKINDLDIKIETDSPVWTLKMDDYEVPYREIETSYIRMIRAFISEKYEHLLPIRAALGMHQAVTEFR